MQSNIVLVFTLLDLAVYLQNSSLCLIGACLVEDHYAIPVIYQEQSTVPDQLKWLYRGLQSYLLVN